MMNLTLWLFIGLVCVIIMLSMREQRSGASLALILCIFGPLLIPIVVWWLVARLLGYDDAP